MLTDEQVWARVRSGEAEGFGLVWDRHRERVFRRLLREGIRSIEAEDLTAVVFLELWRHRESVRIVDGSLLPWLIVTAGNVARNARRSRSRYRAFLARLPEPAEAARAASAGEEDARVPALREAMAGLGRVDRDLLVLTAVEGFSVATSAQAVGLSEGAAKTRLSRLRRRLRSTIDAAVVEGEPS
ncbi:MAG: sigma-70 family RNA polymerase sigma factor [Propionicimonas sp.]